MTFYSRRCEPYRRFVGTARQSQYRLLAEYPRFLRLSSRSSPTSVGEQWRSVRNVLYLLMLSISEHSEPRQSPRGFTTIRICEEIATHLRPAFADARNTAWGVSTFLQERAAYVKDGGCRVVSRPSVGILLATTCLEFFNKPLAVRLDSERR
jgi:hypothetical protein